MPSLVPSPVTLPTDAVTIIDGHAVTTSLAVAQVFGKEHRNVLRDIRNLDCSPEFHALNFERMSHEVTIGNGGTRTEESYRITRDGLTILAFGYTGRLAMRFKEAYIARFNELEARSLPTLPDPDTAARLAHCQAELLRANPTWTALIRYHAAALNTREQATLLHLGETTVRRHLARLLRCGLLPHPVSDTRRRPRAAFDLIDEHPAPAITH